jgi:hypothetical protein
MRTRLVALGLTLLALAGCAADSDPAAAPTSTTPAAATTAPPATYADVIALRDALAGTPAECTDFEVTPDPIGARERAQCTDVLTLGIYDSRADAYASAQEINRTINETLDQRSFHVVGQNWSVNCGDDTYTCEWVRMTLGGEMIGD